MNDKPEFSEFDHPVMIDNKVLDAELGLLKIVGYFLAVKVYGDHTSLTENQLRRKFEQSIIRTNIGDGCQQIKVAELSMVFEALSNVKVDDLRPRAKSMIKATKPKRRNKK